MEITSRDKGPGRVLFCVLLTATLASVSAPPGHLEVQSQWRWPARDDLASTAEPKLTSDKVNVTAVLGHSVTLPCRVANLRDRTVSWIRSRDLSVLAVDRHTVTSDVRFSVSHPEETEDWLLQIRNLKSTDEGIYDCQVNTHPKMSTQIYLKVLQHQGEASILDIPVSDTGVMEPPKDMQEEDSAFRLRVLGERWLRVSQGHSLSLVCLAKGKALGDLHDEALIHNDPLISWLIDGVPVTSLWTHDKVLVRESWGQDEVESELQVLSLHPSDSGTFSCVVLPFQAADRVAVTVTKDPSPEVETSALERGSSPRPGGAVGSSSRAAVISGAIILALLLMQVALCVFYIKKL